MFTFRPNTMDQYVYTQVVTNNEYKLDRGFKPKDIIVDIGGHIGSFSYACWLRGADTIHLFEANPENATMCRLNLADTSVTVHETAVWRSDERFVDTLYHTGFDETAHGANTGGGNVLWGSHVEKRVAVPATRFDTIIDDLLALHGKKRIRLVKIDAETSEFPILLTSSRLDVIDEIIGEFHEVGGEYNDNYIPDHAKVDGFSEFTMQNLGHFLAEKGFNVHYVRYTNSNIGHFFAKRP